MSRNVDIFINIFPSLIKLFEFLILYNPIILCLLKKVQLREKTGFSKQSVEIVLLFYVTHKSANAELEYVLNLKPISRGKVGRNEIP